MEHARERGGVSPRPGDDDRERSAPRLDEIPPRRWRDIAFRVWRESGEAHLSVIAAGVAFYSLLALFPAMTALVSIYGLAANPEDLEPQLDLLRDILPADGLRILRSQMLAIASQPAAGLSWGVALGFGITLWSATAGMKTLMTALNIAYREVEKRSFLRFNLTAMALTLGSIVAAALAILLVVVLPAALGILGRVGWISGPLHLLLSLVHWPILALLSMLGLTILYRIGPSRARVRRRWMDWGAAIATALWIAASALFSVYVATFASYNETYGSLGAAVILLMWLYITAFVVLLGGEINAEIEHEAAGKDAARRPKPPGERRGGMPDAAERAS